MRRGLFGLATVLGASLASVTAGAVSFEPNHGQTDPRVRFLARGRGYVLFLTPTEAVLALGEEPRQALRMKLLGASPDATMAGIGLLPGRSHYFLGSDPALWRRDIPSYEKVEHRSVYPGVDLVYYGSGGVLEYDFVVAPGGDPRRITLGFGGVRRMRIDAEGNLVLAAGGGEVLQLKPAVYQVLGGARRPVEGRYVLRGRRRVGFEVASYDPGRPLVIDPVLSYSTYLGGSGADASHAIALDEGGNAYVTGETASVNFPATSGSFQGGTDAFVTKFDPSGTTRIYSAYLGGSAIDVGHGIAVDAAGSAYVTGFTLSGNFPTTAGAFQTAKAANADVFVTKLNAAGTLNYSTFLGGNGTGTTNGERGNGIALDSAGNVYIAGRTDSANFPTTPGVLFTSFRGGTFDAFVAKLNPSASGAASLVYSTYLGGSGNDAGFGIAVDAAGNPHVAGGTESPFDYPTTGSAYQPVSFDTDAFFTKLNATAAALLYSTFLGGNPERMERANGIALDASGNAYITGQTISLNFPTKNALQAYQGGPNDAFVAKFNPAASGQASLLYSTFLGGSGEDTGRAIAVDSSGRAYVTGQTGSAASFPIANATQPVYGGGTYDAFVTKFNAAGSARLYSTFLGGSGDEGTGPTLQGGHGIAVNACGDAFVTGRTTSTNFPTASPAQPAAGGAGDAFLTKIGDPDAPSVSGVAPAWGPAAGGTLLTVTGSCFQAGATVTLGGVPATAVSVVSPTAITATTPAHAPGPVNLVVTNPGPQSSTLVNGFTYGATGFFTLTPCRMLDTRNPTGPLGGPALAANTDRTFAVTGQCGIPSTAKAISANITITQPTAQGDLRLYPGATPLPFVSSINYRPGQTRANNAALLLGAGGTVAVRCVQASGSVQFLLDVNGYFE